MQSIAAVEKSFDSLQLIGGVCRYVMYTGRMCVMVFTGSLCDTTERKCDRNITGWRYESVSQSPPPPSPPPQEELHLRLRQFQQIYRCRDLGFPFDFNDSCVYVVYCGVHFFRDVMVQNQNISGIPLYQLIKWIQTSKYQRFWIIKVRRYTTSDSYVSLDSLKICEYRYDHTVRLWTEWKIPWGWSKDPGVILLSRWCKSFCGRWWRRMMMIPSGALVPGCSSKR